MSSASSIGDDLRSKNGSLSTNRDIAASLAGRQTPLPPLYE
jgi:hypothetical protein